MASLAKNYSALLIALEHRYYGESIPDSIKSPMSTDSLKYLTVEQALADLAAFTDYYKVLFVHHIISYHTYSIIIIIIIIITITIINFQKEKVNPVTSSVPWFVFGGSYPGALASWYRISYPEYSVGSLSSSGVVNWCVEIK